MSIGGSIYSRGIPIAGSLTAFIFFGFGLGTGSFHQNNIFFGFDLGTGSFHQNNIFFGFDLGTGSFHQNNHAFSFVFDRISSVGARAL